MTTPILRELLAAGADDARQVQELHECVLELREQLNLTQFELRETRADRDVDRSRVGDLEAERDMYRDIAIQSLRRAEHLTEVCWTQRIALDDRSRKDDNYSQGTDAHRHLEAAIALREQTNKLRFRAPGRRPGPSRYKVAVAVKYRPGLRPTPHIWRNTSGGGDMEARP